MRALRQPMAEVQRPNAIVVLVAREIVGRRPLTASKTMERSDEIINRLALAPAFVRALVREAASDSTGVGALKKAFPRGSGMPVLRMLA